MKSLKEALIKKHASFIGFRPGDTPKEGDVIVMTLENTKTHEKEVEVGEYRDEYIEYITTRIEYAFFQESLSWKYNEWVHRIAKVFRGPSFQIELPDWSMDLGTRNDRNKKLLKEIEKNPKYTCIYNNSEISKKFGI